MSDVTALSPDVALTLVIVVSLLAALVFGLFLAWFVPWWYESDHHFFYWHYDHLCDAVTWLASLGKRRQRQPSKAAPPEQPVPPAPRGSDFGGAGQVASGLGEDKSKVAFLDVRHMVPVSTKYKGLPWIEWKRQGGRLHIRVLSQKHCFLRASLPCETNGGDIDRNQPQVGHFKSSDMTFGCHLDGLDIAFNGTWTGIIHDGIPGVTGCLDLHFHPNKAHSQTHDVASNGQHKTGDTQGTADEGNADRNKINPVHAAHHNKGAQS